MALNMINFNAVDFSERCSEEVMFLLALSVFVPPCGYMCILAPFSDLCTCTCMYWKI